MSKLNIFRKEWLDVVFENRNKMYGAYQLRSENPRTTTIALFMGFTLFSIGISSPLIIRALEGKLGDNIVETYDVPPVIWDVTPVAPPVKKVEEPMVKEEPVKVAAESAASAESTKRHVAYTVTDDASKITEEVTAVSELVNANPGATTSTGVAGGVINTTGGLGEGKGNVTDPGMGTATTTGNELFDIVQVKAEPVGGFATFNKMFISRFRSPDVGSDVKKIQVIVRFIVEKDGSLTDITVMRDAGYGVGKEALRVLSEMPKWKAAVQNNRKVRSQFTLPITIQVQ